MKRLLIILTLLSLIVLPVYAGEWCRPGDEETASAAITAKQGLFHGIAVITDATNAVTVSIYDNATAASGRELIPTWTVTTSATDRIQTYSISPPVPFYNGCYVSATTSGTVTYMVYYESN